VAAATGDVTEQQQQQQQQQQRQQQLRQLRLQQAFLLPRAVLQRGEYHRH
jgi:hypothetical protein